MPHFSTAFDWFTADEAGLLQRFVDSYAVFDGVSDPDGPDGGVAFMASQSAGGVYITKNPTDEKHNAGQTAEFIANANVYDDVTWTFVAPDGRTYTVDEIRKIGGELEGIKTGDLKIKNVSTTMNGWGVFATFDYRGASARTSTAYLYVWEGAGTNNTNNFAETIDEFYRMKPWLDSAWGCPKCGAAVSGSQCWACGFNPISFYAIYYGVTPESTDWYYGLNGQTPVSAITPDPFVGVLAWICPVCGESTQNFATCWSCGYHYGDPLGYDSATENTIVEAIMGADLRQCEYCGQWFNSDYDVCPYCYNAPDDGTLYTQTEINQYQEYLQGATLIRCDYCGEYFNQDYDVCPYCGTIPY